MDILQTLKNKRRRKEEAQEILEQGFLANFSPRESADGYIMYSPHFIAQGRGKTIQDALHDLILTVRKDASQ